MLSTLLFLASADLSRERLDWVAQRAGPGATGLIHYIPVGGDDDAVRFLRQTATQGSGWEDLPGARPSLIVTEYFEVATEEGPVQFWFTDPAPTEADADAPGLGWQVIDDVWVRAYNGWTAAQSDEVAAFAREWSPGELTHAQWGEQRQAATFTRDAGRIVVQSRAVLEPSHLRRILDDVPRLQCGNNLRRLYTMMRATTVDRTPQPGQWPVPGGALRDGTPVPDGRDWWLLIYGFETEDLSLFACPAAGGDMVEGRCDYLGPIVNPNTGIRDNEPLGACLNHEDVVIVIFKGGDLQIIDRADEETMADIERLLGD